MRFPRDVRIPAQRLAVGLVLAAWPANAECLAPADKISMLTHLQNRSPKPSACITSCCNCISIPRVIRGHRSLANCAHRVGFRVWCATSKTIQWMRRCEPIHRLACIIWGHGVQALGFWVWALWCRTTGTSVKRDWRFVAARDGPADATSGDPLESATALRGPFGDIPLIEDTTMGACEDAATPPGT